MNVDFTKYTSFFQSGDNVKIIDYLERIKELEYECELMLKYVANKRSVKKNCITQEDIIERYSKLSIAINNLERTKLLDRDETLIQETYSEVIKIHNELSCYTLPATPVTIKYTEFSKGGFLDRNRTVNLLIGFTIFFFLAFLFMNIANQKHSFNFIGIDKEISEQVSNLLLIVTASALGSGFYTLITVRRYLVNRTYSPRYNPTYIIRFILGITSGTILALLFEDDLESFEYSVEILAIVGGFGADAVAITLNRISEVLKTALTGSVEKAQSGDEQTEQPDNK